MSGLTRDEEKTRICEYRTFVEEQGLKGRVLLGIGVNPDSNKDKKEYLLVRPSSQVGKDFSDTEAELLSAFESPGLPVKVLAYRPPATPKKQRFNF